MVIERKEASPREGFAKAVISAAETNGKIVVLGADVTGSLYLDTFAKRYPERFISLGIAEQNIASVAAGLAMSGYFPIMATYATFCTTRALDQIRVSICYNWLNVLIAGSNAGITAGPDGGTHQALEDIAVMRSLPHMEVYSPSDALLAYQITKSILARESENPTYIRLSRMEVPYEENHEYNEGASFRSYGKQEARITIITTGPLYWIARRVVDRMQEERIDVLLLDLYAIKRSSGIEDLITNGEMKPVFNNILTVEEHQIAGGMGSAVAEVLAKYQRFPTISMMGIHDTFGQSAPPTNALIHHELSTDAIYNALIKICRKERLME